MDAVDLGWAMKRLGELRASQGDAAGAADARGRLNELWRRADPEVREAGGLAPQR